MTTIALVGNPNCGKTVLFNALTASRQKVGNWPGVTVEKKLGWMQEADATLQVVDLPGIYSLSSQSNEGSLDEQVACDYLLSDQAQLIVNVIDAANLERNLYLSSQLLEMGIPMILAVNMMDVLDKREQQLDLSKLSAALACPVIALTANRGQGIAELKTAILQMLKNPSISGNLCAFSYDVEQSIKDLNPKIKSRRLAIRLLESNLSTDTLEDADILIAGARYDWSHHIAEKVLSTATKSFNSKKNWSQRIDQVVLNPYLGIPIFLLVMYALFFFAINVAGAFQDFFDKSSEALFVTGIGGVLKNLHASSWFIALMANGLGKGLNTTLTFIPVLAGMFLFLSFLEDSGYMARAAFVMDRCMQALGLPGKSFIPLIVGFGCNVPAMMGARTLSHARDRILTIVMPFMSCSARLAIFAVFVAAFFPKNGAEIIFLLYFLGIVAAILTGLLLRKTVLKGESSPFVMEFPAYHFPHFQSLLRQTWQRLKSFLVRAGKVIIPVCMLLGVLNSGAVLPHIGKSLTPALEPMGIQQNNWPATVGLLSGVLAKEVVIGTLNTLYSAPEKDDQTLAAPVRDGLKEAFLSIPQNLSGLTAALAQPVQASGAVRDMSPKVYGVMAEQFGSKAAAFAYLLFVLLYFPCISTLAVMRREIGKKWACFSLAWSIVLAYAAAVIAYQTMIFGVHPVVSVCWILGMLSIFVILLIGLRSYAGRYDFA
jgi:ferrous iron transport protein B